MLFLPQTKSRHDVVIALNNWFYRRCPLNGNESFADVKLKTLWQRGVNVLTAS